MSIEVTCPQGHCLRVKNEFAGKTGICPHCKERIVVPRIEVTEDDLLALLGPPRPVSRSLADDTLPTSRQHATPHHAEPSEPQPHKTPSQSSPALKDHAADETAKQGTAPQLGAAFIHRRRVCPRCCEIVSFAHRVCPNCETSLSGWSFPLPEDPKAEEVSSKACHYLGLRRQGGVIVIRFGEHRILDEACVKRFGDELFHVAERNDCQNVLLNFTGVVGLSSAMLGIMLMLRKRILQKHGKLKLCLVGPEIMDIFHATKLGQIFEIVGNEQQALKAFG